MATSPPQQLGARIRTARKGKGMTAEEMAPLIGVTMGTLFRYERGETQPNYTRLLDISTVTECPLSWFLEGAAA